MNCKPESPSDRRPKDQPYFIDKTCEDCGEKLRPHYDVNDDEAWFDEFECGCDGIHLDVPEHYKEMLNKRMQEVEDGDFEGVERENGLSVRIHPAVVEKLKDLLGRDTHR